MEGKLIEQVDQVLEEKYALSGLAERKDEVGGLPNSLKWEAALGEPVT